MEIWGEYDDENDYVSNEWDIFIEKYIKQNYPDIYKIRKIDLDKYYDLIDETIKQDKIKIAKALSTLINNKKMQLDYSIRDSQLILGLIIRMAREGKFSSILIKRKLPTKLFSGFPFRLKSVGLTIISKLLLDKYHFKIWKHPNERIKALKKEALLLKL